MRLLGITIASTLVLLAAAGCGGGGTKTIDVGDGNKVTLGNDLPDDFPDNFPIYSGADLQGAAQGEQDGISGVVATWTTSGDLGDVTSFYKDAFATGAWTSDTSGTAGGSTYWAVDEKDGTKVGYVSVSGGDKVTIIATVGDDPSARSDTGDATVAADDSSDEGDSSDNAASSSSDSSTVADDLPAEVALPDGFPKDQVPLPDGARVTSAQSYSANGADTFLVGFHTKDSAQDIGAFYKRELEGNGFTQSIQTSDANGVYAAYAEHPDGTGTIIVVSANDGTVEGYREGVVQVTEG